MDASVIGNFITGSAAVAAIIGLILQSKSTRKQIKLQNFIEYTKRYQEIILNFPENINDGDFKIDALDDETKSKTMRYMRAYFDLCYEELILYEMKYIDDDLWSIWHNGIKTALSKPAFQQAWNIISKDSCFGEDFENFVKSCIENRASKTVSKHYSCNFLNDINKKEKIKDIFDNVKNLFVCAGVLFAASYSFKLPSSNQFNHISNIIIGILLLIGGFILLHLNIYHSLYVYCPSIFNEKKRWRRLGYACFILIYVFLAINIILSKMTK